MLLFSAMAGSAAERYVLSQPQSQMQFQAYSLLAKPCGVFHTFSGEIVADAQDVRASRVRLGIDAASIDTDHTKRDTHLRSKAFLYVEAHSTITFVSTMISKDGPAYKVEGGYRFVA